MAIARSRGRGTVAIARSRGRGTVAIARSRGRGTVAWRQRGLGAGAEVQ